MMGAGAAFGPGTPYGTTSRKNSMHKCHRFWSMILSVSELGGLQLLLHRRQRIDKGRPDGKESGFGRARFRSKCPHTLPTAAETLLGGRHENHLGETSGKFLVALGLTPLSLTRAIPKYIFLNLQKERRILENKRLDLDAAKNRLRKARSADPQVGVIRVLQRA